MLSTFLKFISMSRRIGQRALLFSKFRTCFQNVVSVILFVFKFDKCTNLREVLDFASVLTSFRLKIFRIFSVLFEIFSFDSIVNKNQAYWNQQFYIS